MPDVNPKDNQNNISLSLKLEDPVYDADNGIAAALDGKIYTSVKRNHYLIEAYRWIANAITEKFGVEMAAEKLSGLVATQSFTMSSSGTTINQDVLHPFRVTTSGSIIYFRDKKAALDFDVKKFALRGFAIEGDKVYVYLRTAGTLTLQNSGTATLYYIKSDRIDYSSGSEVAVNTAPDITLNAWANDACTYYAAGVAILDQASSIVEPDPSMIEVGNRFIAMALQRLP